MFQNNPIFFSLETISKSPFQNGIRELMKYDGSLIGITLLKLPVIVSLNELNRLWFINIII